jgi:hypothetical protein
MNVRPNIVTPYSANVLVLPINLRIDRELTVGLLSKQLFDSLKTGNHLQAIIGRTRLSRRLETFDVTRENLVRGEE